MKSRGGFPEFRQHRFYATGKGEHQFASVRIAHHEPRFKNNIPLRMKSFTSYLTISFWLSISWKNNASYPTIEPKHSCCELLSLNKIYKNIYFVKENSTSKYTKNN